MKRVIEKTTKTALIKTALMLFAICFAGGAWATVKPVAIWHGDFAAGAAGARGGYVINANGNTVTPACITIDGSAGVIVTNNTITADLETSALGVVARFTGAVYSSTIRALATTITSADTAGSNRGWFGVNNSTQMTSYYYNINNGGAPAVWDGQRFNYFVDYAWPNSGTHYFGCTYSAEDKDGSSGRFGWRSYVDGVLSTWNNGMFSYSTDKGLYGYGFALGGSTTGYQFTDATIDYIAIVRSAYASDIAYWSLTDMTKSAATFVGSDANTGVNVPASGETISSATAAAAVFVQQNATLGFSGSGTLTIGAGTGPLYIDSGATLTIDLDGVTAPTAENPFVLLVKGQVYGATQVNFINVPANTMTSIGEGGTIALLHNSVYTDLLSSWKSNGQKVFAWRTAGSSSFFSSTANLVDTNTGDIGTSTSISAYNKNGGFQDENPAGVVYYDDIAYVSKATVDYAYFTLGGLFVTAGGSSLYHSNQELKLGDNSSNRKTFNYVFAQSFTLGPFNKNKLYGPVNLTIYEGATLTLSPNGLTLAPNSGYDAGKQAHLMMSGGGVVKTSGTITATGADVTLDYSALDVSRTEPFIQGNLTIDNNTKLVLPAALAANTPYQLCSGTLTVGSSSLQKSITVGSNTFLADLTFDTSAKTVSYYPARTTTVSGGTTEWSSLTWANGDGVAGWDAGANAHITVSAASTISVASATSVAKLKLLGSANLTITGIGNLTVGSFDLSEYTGNLTIAVDSAATVGTLKFIGSTGVAITGISNLTLDAFDLSEYTGDLIVDGGLPAEVTLCGGNLVFDIAGSTDISGSRNYADAFQTCSISGTGNVYKRGVGSFYFGRTSDATVVENSYTGSTYVENGIARRWGAKAFGATGNTVYVGSNASSTATVDLVSAWDGSANYNYHIAGTGFGRYPAMTQRDSSSSGGSSVGSLSLDDDATIGVDSGKEIRMGSYGGNWYLKLNSHTLKKVGLGTLMIDDCYFYTDETAVGIIEVAEGTFRPSCYDFKNLSLKLIVRENATCRTAFWYQSVNRFVINEVENYGTISVDGNDDGGRSNLLYVKTSYTGNGTANRLYLKDGVTVKPTSATTGMTVSGALTLEGTINVDLSGIDLTGRYDLPIIAGPTQIDKDSDVDTFNRGYNSANWGLYSELVSEGKYALGVRLSTVTNPVSWDGEGGTWSVNSFDGGTENYSNQALQTVTFADDAESTTTPLAVTVSGEKTVGALNFTADNRNVTLSGGAITAATVSKSGDGVAIVNNVLSVTTSISVTDGVLVLNPNGEEVANVDGLEAGTLVIYVGSGETRTVTESISATKIVKRGQGTLDLTAVSPSVPMVIDDGKVDVDEIPSANVTIGTDGVLALINDSANVQDANADYSTITGSGILRLQSSSKWRMLSKNNFPTTVTLENELNDGLLLSESGRTYEIGNLAGTKKIRSDYTDGNRHLRINQFGNTEWQGVFADADRIGTVYVRGGASATGTLTLSGEQTHNNSLTVESGGSVNLTGTWVGATTVSGTFGGTGSITGALTLNAGSTFKVWATGGLTATGALTLPEAEEDKITVDASELAIGAQATTAVLTVNSGMNISKFNLSGSTTHFLRASGQTLNLLPIAAVVNGTINCSSVDEALQLMSVSADKDTYVSVIFGTTSIEEEVLAALGIMYDDSDSTYRYAAAQIGVNIYGTLGKAVAAASASGDTITLLRDTAEQEVALDNKSITLAESSYTFSGSFTGNGTVVLTSTLKSAAAARWAEGWTGTVWLKNLSDFTIDPATYGNSDSVIKFTGVSGQIAAGTTCSPAVELEDDGETKALTLNSYSTTSSSTITFNEFKGSGTFATVGGTADAYPRTHFKVLKWDDFTGSLDIDRGRFAFGSDTVANDDWRYIYISEDADVTIAAGKAFTATEGLRVYGSLTVPALSSLSGTIAGSGTITCQALHALDYTPSFGTWTGTVVLPTPLDSINASGVNKIYFNSYGITGSTVKVGSINAGWLQIEEAINPTIEIESNFTLTAFSPQGRPYTFKAFKGSGEFSVSCPAESVANYASWSSDHSAYYLVKDVSNFTGSMTVSNCGIAIGDSKPDYKTPGGKIIVNSGKSATVAAGKTWTAGTNLKVDGSIAVASDGALSGTIEGSGTITYAAVPSALTFGTWTGTVELPSFYAGGAKLDNYGKSGSTITVNGISGGWLDYTTAGSPNKSRHQATLDLRGAVNITAVSGYDYIFDHIKGNGSFSIASNNETMPNSITITKLETAGDAAGVAVNNNTTTTLTVGTLALATEPASGTKILSTGGTGTVTLSAVTVGGAAATFGVKKGDDGYYAGYASTTTGDGSGAVTTVDASSEVSEVTVAVPASYSGKVVIPANVKKLTITGETVSAANIGLKAPYAGNADNIYYGIVNIGEGNVVSLNGEATVGGVKVTPEIKTGDAENPPMAMSGSAPAFSAKAIPGLWYAVKAASSVADLGDKFKYGTPVQATGDTVNIEAPTFPGTVTYYRLSAGMNQDDVTRYIVSTNRLAVRPTTDGLFAYGENSTTTTAAHDCYRIPAIASTWLPGDAGDPLQAIVMGIYDARTSYWDLGQRMNKTSNERQWNNNEHHFAGIDIAGNYSLDGGASWSAAQIMIDVPNAFDPATGEDNIDSTSGINKAYDIGDPAIVYVPATEKFLMMGITGGGNSSVSNITANAMGADLVMYECTASSVANGAPVWQKVTGFTKEGVIALLKAKDDTLTFDYPPNGYSFDYDSTRAWTRETVYFLSILQGPGNALVTREDCGSIKAGTIVFPMQYCAKKRTTDGNHVGISYTFALYSTDNGATWNVTSVCKDEAAYGSECCIAQLDDGSLLMEVRPPNASTKRAFFRSTDFNTWTKACELVESAGPAEGSILRIGAKDGKSVYACSFTTGATRADLQLFIGTDYTSDEDVANVAKGINWTTTPFCTIWKGDTGTASTGSGVDTVVYGYSSLVMLDETTLGVLLEAHGHIYFAKVDVSSQL